LFVVRTALARVNWGYCQAWGQPTPGTCRHRGRQPGAPDAGQRGSKQFPRIHRLAPRNCWRGQGACLSMRGGTSASRGPGAARPGPARRRAARM